MYIRGPISGARIDHRSRRARYIFTGRARRACKKAKARLHGAGIILKRFFLRSLRDFHLDILRYASPFIVSRDADP